LRIRARHHGSKTRRRVKVGSRRGSNTAEDLGFALRQKRLYKAKNEDSRNQPKSLRQFLGPETGVRIPVAVSSERL